MTIRQIGLFGGVALALAMQAAPTPDGVSPAGWVVASLALLMAFWWATEAVPIAVTALLPLAVLPIAGVMGVRDAGAAYFSQIVVLLFGGFMLALALERWDLHKRIALNIVARAGGRPRVLNLGFMIAAALLSMWISNTATTLMLTPVALSVAHAEMGEEGRGAPFCVALLLGLAYAASVGGTATPVGTPTNLIAVGFLADWGREVSFAQWMRFGAPLAAIAIPALWAMLVFVASPVGSASSGGGSGVVRAELAALGGMRAPEIRVAMVFLVVAALWIFRAPLVAASGVAHLQALRGSEVDAVIAISGAIALFLIPAGDQRRPGAMLMDWETAGRLPWNVVLLFGGGLSLAAAIQSTGLATWLGGGLSGLAGLPTVFLAVALVAAIIFLTELTSNVATVTAFMPVIGAFAAEAGVDPVLLAGPAAVAGSYAFMLPVATAPNAIIYATGQVSAPQMARTGFMLNLFGIVLIGLVGSALAPLVFD